MVAAGTHRARAAARAATASTAARQAACPEGMSVAQNMPMTLPERTSSEVFSDVRYAVCYGTLNERFWRRADTMLNLVGAIGGSAAVAGVLGSQATLSLMAGVLVAISSAAQLVLRPADRAQGFKEGRRAFLALEPSAWSASVVEVDAARRRLEAELPIGFRLLEMPAYNAAMRGIGREDLVRPLNWRERIAMAAA